MLPLSRCADGMTIRANKNAVDGDAEYRCKDIEIIQGGHCVAPLPFVDGLRGGEPKDGLQILYRQPSRLAHSGDVLSGGCHVDDRYGTRGFLLFRLIEPGRGRAQSALKL